MLSLSMSFLVRCWARSRGSWAIHRRGRAEKPAKKPDLFSTRPPVGGAPERSQAGFYELRAGSGSRIDEQTGARLLGLFKQPKSAVSSCRGTCASPPLASTRQHQRTTTAATASVEHIPGSQV